MNEKLKLARNILNNQHMGAGDIQMHADIIHAAGVPNDPTIGILGVDSEGKPIGVIFTDPNLSVIHSDVTDRTVITHGVTKK